MASDRATKCRPYVGAQSTFDIGQPGIIPPVVDVMAIE